MSKIYITTDTHFNHSDMADKFNTRPKDFELRILKAHKNLPSDCTLIHLGDFCIGKDAEMHALWNQATGHIKTRILVRGNHDKKSNSWYVDHGWSFVCEALAMKEFGSNILFSHIPMKSLPEGVINIHGHTHGDVYRERVHKWKDVSDYYNPNIHLEIALEKTDYRPVLLTKKLLEAK